MTQWAGHYCSSLHPYTALGAWFTGMLRESFGGNKQMINKAGREINKAVRETPTKIARTGKQNLEGGTFSPQSVGETYNYLAHTKYFLKPQLTKCPGHKGILPLHTEDISQVGEAPLLLLAGSRLPKTADVYKPNIKLFSPQTHLLFGVQLPKERSELTFVSIYSSVQFTGGKLLLFLSSSREK